ncbi:MAG: sigma-54-dependent Fis family transcriptional regulator [candidate division NC10 bacterium]|nr:sigma-54-dependent Fis family transcriptional regulator [candidate division NC10 bacterium]
MEAEVRRGLTALVVDDEENMVHVLTTLLAQEGFGVAAARTGEEALERIRSEVVDLVLLDVRLPGRDGLEVLEAVKAQRPDCGVLMMTAFGSIESAVAALRAGADDYLVKPFRAEEVLRRIQAVLERQGLRREVRRLRREVGTRYGFGNLLGRSPAMRALLGQLEQVAATRSTVLLMGESGTGKELAARALHYNSDRAERPFVVIDCAAIPETLQESELFGPTRGAFTGAVAAKRGLFEEAHGGTLFLDEVGDLSAATQAKLLRVLQEGTIRRLGDTRTIQVDVRIIAATNRDLPAEVRAGRFREDLFFRLNVLPLRLPPLRERPEDIPLLTEHFLRRFAAETGRPVRQIAPPALDCLMAYRWPGNVRELEHAIERAVLLSQGEILEVGDLPPAVQGGGGQGVEEAPLSLRDAVARLNADLERGLIRRALARTGGNRTEAAALLGISRRALLYKLKEYGIAQGD